MSQPALTFTGIISRLRLPENHALVLDAPDAHPGKHVEDWSGDMMKHAGTADETCIGYIDIPETATSEEITESLYTLISQCLPHQAHSARRQVGTWAPRAHELYQERKSQASQ